MAATMVVDASVAVKWFLAADRHVEARAILAGGTPLAAPSLILLEVMNALWIAARQGRTSTEALQTARRKLLETFDEMAADASLFPEAAGLMVALGHPIYDCVYLALAQREDVVLITADERQYAAARQVRIPVHLL